MYSVIVQLFVSTRIQCCYLVTPRVGHPIAHPYAILQCAMPSIYLNSLLPKFRFRLVDLLHKLRVRIGHVVESEDAVAEFEKEEGAEGHEDPDR